ncbi:MAG: hypothetical protein A2V96_02070 [Candidatus Yonathbacteria bacterium RBG_16_43_6]|nr:MAG: hypothetical protein A2V96_02070 [Candidatus Yonathbacteria bacterium RBG_16_43_6]
MRNALIFSITIMLCVGGYFYYTQFVQKELQISDEPKKTEYGTVAPQDFPQDFLSEVNTPLEQSYVLEYPNQKQQTIVFETARSLEENQRIYTEYLQNNGWAITANSFDEKYVSFYASKEGAELNIVVFFDESVAKNKVSISVLNTTK